MARHRKQPHSFEQSMARARRLGRKHGILPPASQLTDRQKQVRKAINADNGNGGALQAFEFLTQRMRVRPNTLITWLTLEAFSPAVILRSEEPLFGGPENWRRSQQLAARLKKDADHVQRVNGSEVFQAICDHVWNRSDLRKSERQQVLDDFNYLPEILRWYARRLEEQTWIARRFERNTPSGTKVERDSLLALLKDVRTRAGKNYFEKVAALISAVRGVAGRPGETRDTLRKRWQRGVSKLRR